MITGYLRVLDGQRLACTSDPTEWLSYISTLHLPHALSFSPSFSFTTTHGSRLTIPFFSSFLSSLFPLIQVSHFTPIDHLFHFGFQHWLESNRVSLCLNPYFFFRSFLFAQCLSTCLLTWALLPPSFPVVRLLLVPCAFHRPQISFLSPPST